MTAEPTPATARRELAKTLRGLRTQRGLGLVQVGKATGISSGFLSRVERGLRGLGDENVDRLSDFYKLSVHAREKLRQLASLAKEKTWWEQDPMPAAAQEYVGFEQAATAIMTYGSIVHGLLQTPAYCEAVLERTTIGDPDADRATVIERRLQRQEMLDRPDPPWVWVILDESGLHRMTGGQATMRDQLAALLTATRRPRLSVRVLPFSAGAHVGMDSRFTMVSTKSDHGAELVHVEGLAGARNLSGAKDLAKYNAAWHSLAALALSDEDSRNLIRRTARDTE